jgi:hypothetical protein
MPSSPITPDVADAAVALRASHPQASAREILDLVLRGRSGAVADLGPGIDAGQDFALLVTDAFDDDMALAWAHWTRTDVDPALLHLLNQRWRDTVLPSFAATYGLDHEAPAAGGGRPRTWRPWRSAA